MKSASVFSCPFCKKINNQKIIFLGSEFSYKCTNCDAVHCFLENPYWDFVDNFKTGFSRYAGSTNLKEWRYEKGQILEKNLDIIKKNQDNFEFILKNQINDCSGCSTFVNRVVFSNKTKNRTCFVSNASHNLHFQECFRGVVRMKEHLLNEYSKETYNILITNELMDCVGIDKLEGLDEVWQIKNYNISCQHHHVGSDWRSAVHLGKTITDLLDGFDNYGFVISKSCKPSIYGKEIIKFLLSSNLQIKLNNYVAILLRPNCFWDREQIAEIWNFIVSQNKIPTLVACTKKEKERCEFLGFNFLYLKDIVEQSYFYENFCSGVICGNGSCCNIPCLHNVPMLVFASSRFFPDDFYCFGRLCSAYNPRHIFGGELEKPENVMEIKVDKNPRIKDHIEDAFRWINNL